ncbi:hypothetical protein IG631_07618 [Alternaria alternata]|jgi:hypothetical protein|nr:hypothetical protein IG631_07618 [Alternaria alternata]
MAEAQEHMNLTLDHPRLGSCPSAELVQPQLDVYWTFPDSITLGEHRNKVQSDCHLISSVVTN